jgi:diaminopimelate decarboxylase
MAGVPPDKIIFSGVGKTRAEMAFALKAGIAQFNVESDHELEALAAEAQTQGVRAPAALRVNPDVDAGSHDKISTGRKLDKFGVAWDRAAELFDRAAALDSLEMAGLAVHIGSQLTALEPFETAFERVAALAERLRERGHRIERIDFGGGLGIRYVDEALPSLADYCALVRRLAARLEVKIQLEPGRHLVGPAGLLLTRVLHVKRLAGKSFVVVDAAMNDLLRPSLYGAHHEVLTALEAAPDAPVEPVDIVGPICESGDVLAKERDLPPLAEGALLAICDTGAYATVMASGYNSRLPAAEVLVRGDGFATIRARPSYDSVLARDIVPDWLV